MADTKIVARPWQPQDLIDDLQGIIDEECDNYLNTRRTTLCMARDYLKEYFAEQKWIPVTERLPSDAGNVLVVAYWHESWQVKVGWYSNLVHAWHILAHDGDIAWVDVTHWMPLPPLPEPPKGE